MSIYSWMVVVILSLSAVGQEKEGKKDAFEGIQETEREAARTVCGGILRALGSPEGMDESSALNRFLRVNEAGYVWYVCLPEECDDTVLADLAGLPNLTYLAAGKTKITDAGAGHVAALKSLEKLHLWKTAMTDGGIGQLKELKELRLLNLGSTKVTDAGIAQLADLENLEELRLNGTGITDKVVEYLKKLRKLQRLWLQDTKVTLGAIAELRKAFINEEPVGSNIRIVRTQISVFHSGTSQTEEP